MQSIHCHSRKLKPYDIVVEPGYFEKIASNINCGNKYLIICDSNIKTLYGDKLNREMHEQGKICSILSFPAGEKHKTLTTFSEIQEQIDLSLDRKSCIIALGGGVTGDMAGFIAGTYMRGINFIQVPCSLLAMVDSSIGGKLGVNTQRRKNSVGIFKSPKEVFIDPVLLKSLPEKFFYDGMAEVIKHALLSGENALRFLEENSKGIMNLDYTILTKMIFDSVSFKVKIVEQDELELDHRRILNLGHTIGHALEEIMGYEHLSHGFAVSIGMNASLYLSHKKGFINWLTLNRIQNLLRQFHLPLFISDFTVQFKDITKREIFNKIQYDKKFEDNVINFVLLMTLGRVKVFSDLSENEIEEGIKYVIQNSLKS